MNMSATTRQAKRKGKFSLSIISIISIFCMLISSANVYLIANILLLEDHGAEGGNGTLVNGPMSSLQMMQPNANVDKINATNYNPSSWTSSHMVDCLKMTTIMSNEEETGMFMPITSNSIGVPFGSGGDDNTRTKQLFLMNIHNPVKDSVSYKIFKEGCFECDHLGKLITALGEYPNSYLLDIGGNIGMWTLVAAASNHDTYTIEPYVDNYYRICKSVQRNHFHNRVHLFNVAATSDHVTLRIDVPNRNKGGGRLGEVGTDDQIMADHHTSSIVDGMPINDLDLPTDRPVILKLDVEGHELPALLGGIEYLKMANIVYAMVSIVQRGLHLLMREGRQMQEPSMNILTSVECSHPRRLNCGRRFRVTTKLTAHGRKYSEY